MSHSIQIYPDNDQYYFSVLLPGLTVSYLDHCQQPPHQFPFSLCLLLSIFNIALTFENRSQSMPCLCSNPPTQGYSRSACTDLHTPHNLGPTPPTPLGTPPDHTPSSMAASLCLKRTSVLLPQDPGTAIPRPEHCAPAISVTNCFTFYKHLLKHHLPRKTFSPHPTLQLPSPFPALFSP